MLTRIKLRLGKESTCNLEDLGWEDPLEKGMATHSSVLAWRIPGTEEPGGLQSMESQRVGHNSTADAFTSLSGYVRFLVSPLGDKISSKEVMDSVRIEVMIR